MAYFFNINLMKKKKREATSMLSLKQGMRWKASVMVLAIMLLLAACGGNNPSNSSPSAKPDTNGDTAGDEAQEAPLKFSIMSHFFGDAPPDKNGDVQKLMEAALNAELDIQWVSSNNYLDRFNVTIASKNIPDVIFVSDPFGTIFRSAVAQGGFWDLTEYYPNYPNLTKNISETAWELTKMGDGRNYGIPRPRPTEAETFLMVRKDWLDQLNLPLPTTTDELYEVMKAFVENDMSGDGQTVGFTGFVNPENMGGAGGFGPLIGAFTGATGDWKLQDGKLNYVELLPEMHEALEFLQKAYSEKLLPADFASLRSSQSQDIYKAGQAGFIIEKASSISGYLSSLGAMNPEADYNILYPLTSINGYNPQAPGFAGMLAIPKSVPEEKLLKILERLDLWMSEDVFDIQEWGIEGVHHEVVDGKKTIIEEKFTADSLANYNQIIFTHGPYASSYGEHHSDAIKEAFGKVQDERAKSSVPNYSVGLYSETALTYLPELQKKTQDLKIKVILGSATMEDWDAYVAKLAEDVQLKKIIEEINASYQARIGG